MADLSGLSAAERGHECLVAKNDLLGDTSYA
jgi:hypothetical protein